MLQKNFLSINFAKGIDTNTDKKLVQIGSLVASDNARFITRDTMVKRPGYNNLGNQAYLSGNASTAPSVVTIANSLGLGTYKDELLNFTDSNIYSRSSTNNEWIDKGFVSSNVLSIRSISSSVADQLDQAVDVLGNLEAYVWTEGQKSCRFSLYDRVSNNYIASNALVVEDTTDGVFGSKVFFLNNRIFIFYIQDGLKYKVYNPLATGLFDAPVTLASGCREAFDIERLSPNRVLFACDNGNTTTVTAGYITNLGLDFSEAISASIEVNREITFISVKRNPISLNVAIGIRFMDVTGESLPFRRSRFRWLVVGSNLTTSVLAITNISALFNEFQASTDQPLFIDAVNSTTFRLFYQRAENTGEREVEVYDLAQSNGAGTLLYRLRNVALLTKPRLIKGVKMAVVRPTSTTVVSLVGDPTVSTRDLGAGDCSFLLVSVEASSLFKVYGKFASNAASVFDITGPTSSVPTEKVSFAATNLPEMVQISDEVFVTAFPSIFRFESSASVPFGGLVEIRQTRSAEFNFNDAFSIYSEESNAGLTITGAVIMDYDQSRAVENNFLYPPTVISAGGFSGGTLAVGTYIFYFVYEWFDSEGRVHRSAPSRPAVLVNTVANAGIIFRVKALNIGEKISTNQVNIVPYRTILNGTIAYRISAGPVPQIVNDPSADTVNMSISSTSAVNKELNVSDADLIANEILYIQGGELENFPPPSAKAITAGKDRVFLVSAEDENTVVPSKIITRNRGLSFNPDLEIRVPRNFGGLRALQVMDEKLICFAERGAYFIAGDGPNNLGLNNTFTDPIEISSTAGAVDQNGVVLTPDGIMFKSEKGIYLLNRSLQMQYVGADVSAFNNRKVLASTTIPEFDEVRFFLDNGTVLVYNYFFKDQRGIGPWLTWSNFSGKDAVVWKGNYAYLKQDNSVFLEDKNIYTDDGSQYTMAAETAWIKLQGVQNFQRVWKAHVLGNFRDPHRIRTRVAYDYEDFYREELYWDATAEFLTDIYGSGLYGSIAPFGGLNEGVYQFSASMPRQKCVAIKFRFEETNPAGGNEGFELSNLTMEIGSKDSGWMQRTGRKI